MWNIVRKFYHSRCKTWVLLVIVVLFNFYVKSAGGNNDTTLSSNIVNTTNTTDATNTTQSTIIPKLPPPGPECAIGRSCDPSLYEKGCDTSTRKFIIFGNDGSGIGNQLVFFPAVYVIAIAQGRQILLEDDTVVAKLCNLLDSCNFRSVHNASTTFPELKSSLRNIRTVKLHEFVDWSENPTVAWSDIVVRASGYKEDLSWWAHSSPLSACLSRRHNTYIAHFCCYKCIDCVASQSLKALFPGNQNRCTMVKLPEKICLSFS